MIPYMLSILVCTFATLCAADTGNTLMSSIPIRTIASKGERILLTIKIPLSAYKPTKLENHNPIRKFIERTEESIKKPDTLKILKGNKSTDFLNTVVTSLKKESALPGGNIIDEHEEQYKDYTVTTLIIKRSCRKNNTTQLVGVQCYVGSTCAGIKYIVNVDTLNEADALQKIKDFFDNNLSIETY